MTAFAYRMPWRETRGAWRHFSFFLLAISLGVAAVVTVGLLTANLDLAIQREARSLMAADLELRTTRPLTPEGEAILKNLEGRGVAWTQVSELVAMASVSQPGPERAGHASPGAQLIELKAIESGYPFYGTLRAEPANALTSLFAGNNALAEETLLVRLNVRPGDALRIGQAVFRITGVLKKEPDRAAGAFSFGPRVLISRQGLLQTELLQPGSRVTHRHLLKVPTAENIIPVKRELADAFPDKTVRINTYQESQPALRRFLGQLAMYLGLIGLIALIVAGIAVATSVRAFLKEKQKTIAILKVLGASPGETLAVYLLQTALLGLLGSLAGTLLGVGLQFTFPPLIRQWLPVDLQFHLTWWPVARGLAMGTITTLLFALWPLWQVREVRPNLVFRREVSAEPIVVRERLPSGRGLPGRGRGGHRGKGDHAGWVIWLATGFLALTLGGLALWQAGSWRIGGLFIAALTLALGLLYGTAWVLVATAQRLPRGRSLIWRQAIANLYRPGSQAKPILISVGVGVMVVLAIHLVEQNMLWEIGENLPTDAPSFFFIDIQPDQQKAFARLLAERGQADARLTPLVRARLSSLNGQPIVPETYERREHGWYFTREYVLTFQEELPRGNVVIKGLWWGSAAKPGEIGEPRVSVEEEAARRLGLDLGSTVVFDILGAKVSSRVGSIRKVDWGTMSTNFYFIFEPGALEGAPMTYVATARVAPQDEVPLQQAVVAAFPNVSAINIRGILDSVARVIDRITFVIRMMASTSILAGAIVLAGGLSATRFQRIYEAVILKVLGATRRPLVCMLALEYALLGAAAGLIGSALAMALAWGVTHWILDIPWRFQPAAMAKGFAATVLMTLVVGLLSTYRILGQKPLPVLRRE